MRLSLVNRTRTELFKLGPSIFVHVLLMTRGRQLLIFKVRGQRSRSRYTLFLNRVNKKQTEPFNLGPGINTFYEKRTTLIAFQGRGSEVKVRRFALLLNLLNRIQTEPFQLGPSDLVYILLMTGGQHLLVFKVRSQRSRSHIRHSF